MQHRDVIEAMASDLGSKAAARDALNAFIRAMWYGLTRDGQVTVRELGTFEVKDIPPRTVAPVGTDGERVAVGVSKLCAFRMSKPLKRQLRGAS